MLSLFKSTKTKNSKQYSRESLISFFYSYPEHSWIIENKYIKANFDDFFELIPSSMLGDIVLKYGIIFAPISARFSCAISSANVILVFPELNDLLASTAISNYKAILAHELGHILQDHGSKALSVIEAQVEADALVIKLGFSEDLESFLLDQPESIEKRIRLSYLTSRYYNRDM